jgi:hypothetical protein
MAAPFELRRIRGAPDQPSSTRQASSIQGPLWPRTGQSRSPEDGVIRVSTSPATSGRDKKGMPVPANPCHCDARTAASVPNVRDISQTGFTRAFPTRIAGPPRASVKVPDRLAPMQCAAVTTAPLPAENAEQNSPSGVVSLNTWIGAVASGCRAEGCGKSPTGTTHPMQIVTASSAVRVRNARPRMLRERGSIVASLTAIATLRRRGCRSGWPHAPH